MHGTIQYTYTRPGKQVDTYQHSLVVDESDLKVMLMENYQGHDLVVGGDVVAEHGSSLLWFVFPGRWHDIGRFHSSDDRFTGWYTNLCTPVVMDGNRWSSTDLFLDHWMHSDGRQTWLDEDELEEAVGAGLLDKTMQKRIRDERVAIQIHLDAGTWPTAAAAEMDLETARALLLG